MHVFLHYFFFLWKFRKILQQFLYPIAFCTEWEKKNSKLKREGRSIGDGLQPYFSPSLFFLCTFTKILYHFFFYPISFCSGINTKTVEKNTRNWKGKAGAFETYSYFFFLWTFTKILYIFVSILLLFVLGYIKYKNKKKSKLKREGRSITNVLLRNKPFFPSLLFF